MPNSNQKSQTLGQYQKLFTENLLTEQLSYIDAENLLGNFVSMFESSEEPKEAMDRFAIYRNNVILSLSTAVADTFPVVKRLIGDDCFNATAIAFVRAHPPEQPSLLFYGEKFIEYIKHVPACKELSYLSDVARVEWSYIRAFHAEDSEILSNEELQQIAPESLAEVSFSTHPSVQLMQSEWPVDVIWDENLKEEVATINLDNLSSCNLLIYRQGLEVQVVNLTAECFNFLEALADGMSIADAWSITVEKNSDLDENEIAGMLGYIFSLSIFTAIQS